ncbi:NADH-cytochrome b5 reductase-like isoform X6 [Panthera tigris]|uniref:NADH-cytochrome b5 reductase-like isoform X6 n=1 Tax=Panthera tigris TaxID=9694 RepID=UPI001C6FA300|nr:NADH-cytochrome b5 reductase-like isoform X6 [Panthera tigris]
MMDEREEEEEEEAWLQLRPVEPLPSQCCGSGCSPCVFDLYHRELARWEAARASKDRSLLSGEESQSCPSKLNPETFLAFRISAVDRLTKDTYRVRFALPRNSRLGLRPGQHLILRGKVDDLEIQRAYTPISPANAEGYFEVLIKSRSYYPTLWIKKRMLRVMMSLSQGPLGNRIPSGRTEVRCQFCLTGMYRAGFGWVLETQKNPSFLLECCLCGRAVKAPAGAVPPPRPGPENRCAGDRSPAS